MCFLQAATVDGEAEEELAEEELAEEQLVDDNDVVQLTSRTTPHTTNQPETETPKDQGFPLLSDPDSDELEDEENVENTADD